MKHLDAYFRQNPDFEGFINKLISYDPHTDKDCVRKCQDNPHCLKALEFEFEIHNTCSDFKGLKNYGATCYLNTLLQLWFHNLELRSSLLQQSVSSPIAMELQRLFLRMQHYNGPVEPLGFVEILGLDPMIQQDALEFSKLLMSLLESVFEKDPILSHVFQSQFQGKQAYVTECLVCGAKSENETLYYELEINLDKSKTLAEGIQTFLGTELLNGSNQYHCRKCDRKVDAKRYIELKSLPPTLNLQINRFAYDYETMVKRKTNHSIDFPSEMDLSAFAPMGAMYDLVGVLLHRGLESNSGHYTIKLKSEQTGNWYEFDDESVYKLDELDFNDGEAKKKPKPEMLSSNCCYLLVYRKRQPRTLLEIDPVLLKQVQEENAQYDPIFALEEQTREEMEHYVKQLKSKWEHVQQVWKPTNEMYFVSSEEIQRIEQESLECFEKRFRLKPETINSTSLLCSHQKLDPKAIVRAACLSPEGVKAIEKIGLKLEPLLRPQDLCRDCAMVIYKEKMDTIHHEQIYNRIKAVPDNTPYVYISKPWYTQFRRKNPLFPSNLQDPNLPVYVSHCKCEHGNLKIDGSDMMPISKGVYQILQELYPLDLLPYDSLECQECMHLQTQSRNLKSDKEKALREKPLIKRLYTKTLAGGDLFYLIPNQFAKPWKQFVDYPLSNPPPTVIDYQHLYCQHQLLLYKLSKDNDNRQLGNYLSQSDFDLLQREYPLKGTPVFIDTDKQQNVAICTECRHARLVNFESGTIHIKKTGSFGEVIVVDEASRKRRKKLREHLYSIPVTPETSLFQIQLQVFRLTTVDGTLWHSTTLSTLALSKQCPM
ncbi:hypothetical protein EDD86DRAFT_210686 [Gorgonomyces haynaldii]|nr:hypothetical protein EDD86DRAFT_210686 [Gorgonomyces haynaldii]